MKKICSKFIGSILAFILVVNIGIIDVQATQLLEVHHINVGQGEAIYIELPDGTDILIDAGRTGQGQTVVNYLRAQESNIDIEYLIATHPDADHVGGMQAVFEELEVKAFYYPMDTSSTTQTWNKVLELAKKEGCKIVDAKSNTSIGRAGVTVKFIHNSVDYSDNNDDSVVTYIDYKDAEFLLTGDIGSDVEEDLIKSNSLFDVDFMSVSHHGSKYSTSTDFLNVVKPEYAIISVGNNSYGHPTGEVLNRLSQSGAKIYRTDRNGHVVIKTNGNTATINSQSVDIGATSNSDWESHWARNEIRYAMNNKWVNSSNIFRPNDAITRAEFIKIVNKSFGFTAKATSENFSDVSSNDWWYNEVLIAIKAGYITTNNRKFRPNDAITREEVASIITSIMKNKDNTLDKIQNYSDKNLISKWALSSVEGAIEAGYMGKNSTIFNPKKNITRAEAIVTLYRVVK